MRLKQLLFNLFNKDECVMNTCVTSKELVIVEDSNVEILRSNNEFILAISVKIT